MEVHMNYIKERGYLYLSTKRFFVSLLCILFIFRSIPSCINSGSFLEFTGSMLVILAFCILLCIPEYLYSKKSSEDLWIKWIECHSAQKLQDRLKRALVYHELIPLKIDTSARCGRFANQTSKKRYRTTLHSCTCPDFKKRKLPCKHMYYLADQRNLQIQNSINII